MTANIAQNKDGKAMLVLAREPAWHHLGEVFTDKPELVEAFRRASLDYEISLIQGKFEWNGKLYEAKNNLMAVKHPVFMLGEIPGEEEPTYLGNVSSTYSIVQNMELAEMYNDLSKKYPVETAGALGDGETVFFTLDAGEVEVNGDLLHQFLLVSDNKIAMEKTKICYTPIRVVCQNTLMSGYSAANLTVNIRHTRGNKETLEKIAQLIGRIENGIEATNKLFAGMGKAHFSLEEFKELLATELYPQPKKEEKVFEVGEDVTKEFQKLQEHQESCLALFSKFNDEHMAYANTSWAGLQAVVEYEDHVREGRGKGNYSNVLFGARSQIVKTAFSALPKA